MTGPSALTRPATIDHWLDGKPWAGTSERTSPVFNPATGAVTRQVRAGVGGRRRHRRQLGRGRGRRVAPGRR